MYRKRERFIVNLFIIIVSFSVLLYAYQNGITGRTLKSGTLGCDCHDPSPSSNVSVIISGPDTLLVNQTAVYKVTISGGPLIAAGTDIAASNGTLSTIQGNSDLQILDGELTHTSPKQSGGASSVSFQFNFTASPSTGKATIYANGNSVNFDHTNQGDQWNFAANKSITITMVSGIEDQNVITSYKLDQNYPNPFNPSTKIKFTLPEASNVKLTIYDDIGKQVAVLVNDYLSSGTYRYTWNAANLASGIYFYRIEAKNFNMVKKMVLMK